MKFHRHRVPTAIGDVYFQQEFRGKGNLITAVWLAEDPPTRTLFSLEHTAAEAIEHFIQLQGENK